MARTKMGFCKFKLENYPFKFKAILADLKLDLASPKLIGVTPGGWQLRCGVMVAHKVDGEGLGSRSLCSNFWRPSDVDRPSLELHELLWSRRKSEETAA